MAQLPLNVTPPPWHGKFEGEYKGRRAWWAEPNTIDPEYSKNRWRYDWPIIRENDVHWWDPQVPAEERKHALYPKDDVQHGVNYMKLNQKPIPIEEWRLKMENDNAMVKDIKAKYNISKEHPGFKFALPSWGGNTVPMVTRGELGNVNPMAWFFGKSISNLGPRFHDTPIHVNCHEKAFALMKLGALAVPPLIFYDTYYTQPASVKFFKHFPKALARNGPFPVLGGLALGSVTCITASFRQKDDVFNPLAGVASAAFIGHMMKGYRFGQITLFGGGALAIFYQFAIKSSGGLMGRHALDIDHHIGWPLGNDLFPKHDYAKDGYAKEF